MSLPKWIGPNDGCEYEMKILKALTIAWEALRWTTQTVHQAHHIDEKGTWETCKKGICPSVRYEMGRIEEIGK